MLSFLPAWHARRERQRGQLILAHWAGIFAVHCFPIDFIMQTVQAPWG